MKSISRATVTKYGPLLLLVLALVIIGPQLQVFRASISNLHDVDYRDVTVAFGSVGMTFVLGALGYKLLAFRSLPFARTLVAQIAANFINRLLPAGVGGIGANYRYLRRQGHSLAQAASVVAANNSLGVIGNVLIIVLLTTVFHAHAVPLHISRREAYVASLIIVLIIMTLTVMPKLRHRLQQNVASLWHELRLYRTHPLKLLSALGVQICLTMANVTAFWLCVAALHHPISLVSALLVFSFGFGVGAAVPTPGGLGGIEAGLVAGLVTYHIPSSEAVAAVVVYRLVSYWLPLIISAPVLLYASRHQYFS